MADDEHIEPLAVPERRPDEPIHLMYAGSIGLAQNLDNVLEALAKLPRGTARLTLVGEGPAVQLLHQRVTELGLDNVRFTGRVARDNVPELQATAHLNLISLADQNLFRITIPSKLQALAAHGAPILCTAPGEAAQLVRSNRMGVTAPRVTRMPWRNKSHGPPHCPLTTYARWAPMPGRCMCGKCPAASAPRSSPGSC